jgi:hypothetical protein
MFVRDRGNQDALPAFDRDRRRDDHTNFHDHLRNEESRWDESNRCGPSDGWNPGNGDGWNPGNGDGWNPGNGNGWNPGNGDGWNPGNGNGWNPGNGNGWNPGNGNGWNPGNGDGWNPGNGNGWNPGNGNGWNAGNGNGWGPGNGWDPRIGSIGSGPINGCGAGNGCGGLTVNGNTVNTGRYTITASPAAGGTLTVTDNLTGKNVTIWGDPHITTDKGDTANFQHQPVTLALDDGTRITIDPTNNPGSVEYINNVSITKGNDAVEMSGLHQGNLQTQFEPGAARLEDAEHDPGTIITPINGQIDQLQVVGGPKISGNSNPDLDGYAYSGRNSNGNGSLFLRSGDFFQFRPHHGHDHDYSHDHRHDHRHSDYNRDPNYGRDPNYDRDPDKADDYTQYV